MRFALLGLSLIAIAGAIAIRLSPRHQPLASSDGPAARVVHYVNPSQMAATAATANSIAPALNARDHTGNPFHWPDEGTRPVLVVFVKDGCPCSVEFEPFFHRLHAAYSGSIRFVGAIDVDVVGARRFAERNGTPYPLLPDPACEIVRRFGADNGAYVALLSPDGTVDRMWPGLSVEAYSDIGRRLAAIARVPERPLDTTGLPDALVTGCPFDRH